MGDKNKKKRVSKDFSSEIPASTEATSAPAAPADAEDAEDVAESGKKKKGKKKAGKGKSSKFSVDMFSEGAMENAYYLCHNVQDLLKTRGFMWPYLAAKKKKGKGRKR